MCLRFFSLSFSINEITDAGTIAKAIEIMKDIDIPLLVAPIFKSV